MGKKPASLWPVCSDLKATSAVNWAGWEHLENPCHQGLNINSIPFRTHAVFNLNDSTHLNSHVALVKPSMKLKNTGQLLSNILTSRRIMDYMDYIQFSNKCCTSKQNHLFQLLILLFMQMTCWLCTCVRCKKKKKKVIKQQI